MHATPRWKVRNDAIVLWCYGAMVLCYGRNSQHTNYPKALRLGPTEEKKTPILTAIVGDDCMPHYCCNLLSTR